ncbi:MAG: hypothetical protein HRF49_02290 [bacterium]|jgi:hypothetical protein
MSDEKQEFASGEASGQPAEQGAQAKDESFSEKAVKVTGQIGVAAGKVAGKVARGISKLSVKVAEKSGELYEQGKLEIRIHGLDRKISEAKREIGDGLYNLWANGRVEDRIVLDLLGKKLEELADIYEERAQANELLENIRRAPPKGEEKDEHSGTGK